MPLLPAPITARRRFCPLQPLDFSPYILYAFNLGAYLRVIPGFDKFMTISGIAGLAIYLVHLAVIWFWSHPVHQTIFGVKSFPDAFHKGTPLFHLGHTGSLVSHFHRNRPAPVHKNALFHGFGFCAVAAHCTHACRVRPVRAVADRSNVGLQAAAAGLYRRPSWKDFATIITSGRAVFCSGRFSEPRCLPPEWSASSRAFATF